MNIKKAIILIFSFLIIGGSTLFAEGFPFGVVAGPAGNSLPSKEEQLFHYNWIRQCGFNIVEHEMMPVAEGWFDWATTQPEPQKYDWKVYDQIVLDCESSDLDVFLEVFTWRATPGWFFEKYPEAYMYTPLAGSDTLSKVMRDPNEDTPTYPSLAHPELIKYACDYVSEIAKRYKDKKNVKGYIIGEEQGLNGVWPPATYYGIDFSPAAKERYHEHLKKKFKTIDSLNEAWNCPGRYNDFSEIIWKKSWAYDYENYRGEWQEYYQCLQKIFAEFHNKLAQSIHKADPNAKVMISAYDYPISRIGHGAHLPLFDEVDIVAYKSYWHRNKSTINFCRGASGGKEIWCSNFSERETTIGTYEQQRHLEPRYLERELWSAIGNGLKGGFLFVWSSNWSQATAKMMLQVNLDDGSQVTIPAIETAKTFNSFMAKWWLYLKDFKPTSPKIVLHDPDITFIGQFWQNADPGKVRAHSAGSSAQDRYMKMMGILTEADRNFTISTEDTFKDVLDIKNIKILSLSGCDLLTESVAKLAIEWTCKGNCLIIDDNTGLYSPYSVSKNYFKNVENQDNILILNGERWDEKETEIRKLEQFITKKVPLNYKILHGTSGMEVGMMSHPNGDELAIVVRKGSSGKIVDNIEFQIQFDRNHKTYSTIDPLAINTSHSLLSEKNTNTIIFNLNGYQETLLILGSDKLPIVN